MGIWDLLTKPIKLTSAVFYWHEPMLYRLKLRGDLLVRCVFALSVWAAASGMFCLLFALNGNPPGIELSFLMGAILGLGPAFLAMFFRRDHVSGTLWVYDDHILRQRSYVSLGFFRSWSEMQEWPNECISRCLIIPNRALGRSFSVMLLSVDSRAEIVGIPSKIKLKELARHFTESGIPVEKRDSLPDRYSQGFDLKATAAMALVGVLLLSVGLGFHFERVPQPGNRIAVRENAPNLQPNFPQPPGEVQFVPNPVAPNPIAQDNEPTKKKKTPVPPAGKPNSTPPNIMPNPTGLAPRGFPNQFPNRPGTRTPPPGTPAARPNTPAAPPQPASNKGNDSKLIGNPQGGFPFRTVNGEGKTLLGFQYAMGSWAGEPAVRSLTPIYDRVPGSDSVIVAKEGYAVGGLKVDAPKYVSAVQIIFQRIKPDDQLDPDDSYNSEWIGKPSQKEVPTVTGNGKKAIGIQGRRGAIIDALGLVFE
ncbi:hypothetical protein Pan241w_37560 [Gimesia alba]|uniref:Uncharacterized protein n=1 Tax=Gimesia alba TaxID=2527973 RepID=A0A517RIF0_9PLAN|nr:hypothetical protein [Gimesia alba]QDT43654.1 hypothetical protein Pan241w_37560 [Gimesia alba]